MHKSDDYVFADHYTRQVIAATLAAALLPLVANFKDVPTEQSIKIAADLYHGLLKEIRRK
jgi:hypothetical protein